MTPATFSRRMAEICAQRDISAVKRDAMLLITRELGEGMPAYLPSLEMLSRRLEQAAVREARRAPEPIL